MNKDKIKSLAIESGFKLKEQKNGRMDLNSYVYDFANKLTQYNSIVKKVDADNLPGGWGLCFDSKNNIHYGYIAGTNVGNLYCETESHEVYDITHYIEQKDLTGLIALGEEE